MRAIVAVYRVEVAMGRGIPWPRKRSCALPLISKIKGGMRRGRTF